MTIRTGDLLWAVLPGRAVAVVALTDGLPGMVCDVRVRRAAVGTEIVRASDRLWRSREDALDAIYDEASVFEWSDGEEAFQIVTFEPGVDAHEAVERGRMVGLAVDGFGCGHGHDCCGCWFGYQADVTPGPFGTVMVIRAARNV